MRSADLRSGREYRLAATAVHSSGTRRARLDRITIIGSVFHYLVEETGDPVLDEAGEPAWIRIKTGQRVESTWEEFEHEQAIYRRRAEVEAEMRLKLAKAGIPSTPVARPSYKRFYDPDVWVRIGDDAVTVTGLAISCYEPASMAQLWAALDRAAVAEEKAE